MQLHQVRIALARLEAELRSVANGRYERHEVQRRTAEHYVSVCLERAAPWSTTRRALRKLDQLGYSNVDRRVYFAVLLGRYAMNFRAARRDARARIGDTLLRVRRLRRSSEYRRQNEPLLQQVQVGLCGA